MENLSIYIVHENFATLLMEVFLLPCHMPQISKKFSATYYKSRACFIQYVARQGAPQASKPTSLRTEFCESQRSQLSSQQPGRLQRMLKPPQFILLPLVSALLSTVHCLCHMHQASKLHSPICSHNSTVATSCAPSARGEFVLTSTFC